MSKHESPYASPEEELSDTLHLLKDAVASEVFYYRQDGHVAIVERLNALRAFLNYTTSHPCRDNLERLRDRLNALSSENADVRGAANLRELVRMAEGALIVHNRIGVAA